MRIFAWPSALLFFLIATITAYLLVPLPGPPPSGAAVGDASREAVERVVTDTFERLRVAVTKRREEAADALCELDVESLLPGLLDLERHSPPRGLPEVRSSLEGLRSAAGLDLLALVSLRGDVVVSVISPEKGEEPRHLREVVAELARALPPDSGVSSGIEVLPLPDEPNRVVAPQKAVFFTALRPLQARPDIVSGVLVAARRLSGTLEDIVRPTAFRWHLVSVGARVVIEGDLVGTEIRLPLAIELRQGLRTSAPAFGDEGPHQIGLWGPLISTSGAITGAVGVTAPPGETVSPPLRREKLSSSRLFGLACLVGGALVAVFILAVLVPRAGAG